MHSTQYLFPQRGVHSKTFRVIDRQIRAAGPLKAAGVKVRSWTGDAHDRVRPAIKDAPWIRLTPDPEAASLETEGTTESDLGIRVETFVEGLLVENSMDLWEQVRACLYPGDKSLLAKLAAADVRAYSYQLGKPAFGEAYDESNVVVGWYAAGFLLVRILDNTLT